MKRLTRLQLFFCINLLFGFICFNVSKIIITKYSKCKSLNENCQRMAVKSLPSRWQAFKSKLVSGIYDFRSVRRDKLPFLRSQISNAQNLNHCEQSQSKSILCCGGRRSIKKVLILICDTGGGHRSSAQAINKALSIVSKGKIEVCIDDIWTNCGRWPFNKFVPGYRYLSKHPTLWHSLYVYGNFPITKRLTELWSMASNYKSFKKSINEKNPDLVVSMHPLCQNIPLSVISEMNCNRRPGQQRVSFATIVTDLGGAHSTWFDKRADYLFVPTEQVRDIAIKYGIKKDSIKILGLPVRQHFWNKTFSKLALRKKLGIRPSSKSVLVMGGGDGIGNLYEVSSEICKSFELGRSEADVTVICGRNSKVLEKLQSGVWSEKLRVHVKGFVNNIHEYMGASDCLVTKAGPGTIAEAMIVGVPLVLSSFLPGQEAGNVPYVVGGGFGVFSGSNPKIVANCVTKLCCDKSRLSSMSKLAKIKSKPNSSIDIARDLTSILFTNGSLNQ